jgi:hypothetical protein
VAAQERVAQERVAQERVAQERVEQVAQERVAQERVARERAAPLLMLEPQPTLLARPLARTARARVASA